MSIVAVEGSLSLTVVDEAEGVIVIFGGETEGVVGGEGILCDGGSGDRTGDSAEGGVVVVCGDAIALFKVHHLRHILIAVTSVEEFITCATLSKERSRRHRFRQVPCRMSPRKMFI